MAVPVQEFQIGQRVRPHDGQPAFTIDMIYAGIIEKGLVYCGSGFSARASELTLAPERPPYVPSERWYRYETDTELAARHAAERAEYDQQDATDRQVCDYPICSTRGAGHPLACNCRTATPKAAP